MKWEGIFLSIVLSLVLTWGNSYPFSEAEDECGPAREIWSRAISALEDGSNAYGQTKAASLEPAIRARMSEIKGKTTVARIVRDAITAHDLKLAESRNELLETAEKEKTCFAQWRTCVSRMPARNRRADRDQLATAEKQRKAVYKRLHLLLIDPAFIQYKDSHPRRVPDEYGYNPYWR